MSSTSLSLRPIVLVGLPGAGKSTVGRHLSKLLRRPFFDTDQLLEQRLGCPIHQSFERDGEEHFRDLESEVLGDVLHRAALAVVATGGGIVKRASNRSMLAENAVVVYLHATPRDLAARLRHDVRRPLLQGGDRLEKLERLLEERHPLYAGIAHCTFDSIGRPLNALLQEVSEWIARDESAREHAPCRDDHPDSLTAQP